MKQWNQIETAPKDGTRIILGKVADPENEIDAIVAEGFYIEGLEDGLDYMGYDAGFVDNGWDLFQPARSIGNPAYQNEGNQPTHWMPLPPPPNASECDALPKETK